MKLRNVPHSDLELKSPPRATPGVQAASGEGTHAPGAKGGYQAGKGQEGTDIERFARVVDTAVWERYSRRNGLPLTLCAESEYHPIFRRISRNTNLLPEGIKINPHHLDPQLLREEAWRIIGPHFRERVDRIIDVYRAAQVRRLASDDLPAVSKAVAIGKVGTLLVDEDRQIPAKLDAVTGQVNATPPGSADDVLDELAETVLRRDGQVLILPHDQMPTTSGVAAIYRY